LETELAGLSFMRAIGKGSGGGGHHSGGDGVYSIAHQGEGDELRSNQRRGMAHTSLSSITLVPLSCPLIIPAHVLLALLAISLSLPLLLLRCLLLLLLLLLLLQRLLNNELGRHIDIMHLLSLSTFCNLLCGSC
jgi:hypothetical protein